MSLANIPPTLNPQDWDVITVKGIKSPGLAIVGEGKRSWDWDVKKGKGLQGAYLTYTGKPPLKFSVRFELWDDGMRNGVYFPQLDHFAAWDDFVTLLQYDPTKKTVSAIDFYHPSFEGLGLRSVVTESVSNLVHQGEQLYVVNVEFIEYTPPPPQSAVASPTSSATNPTAGDGKNAPAGATPDPAVIAAQQELQKALSDAKTLGPL